MLYNDNQGAEKLAKNNVVGTTKHIDIKYHFLREVIEW